MIVISNSKLSHFIQNNTWNYISCKWSWIWK